MRTGGSSLVLITDAGERVVDEVDHMGEALGTGLRQGLSREERTQLVSILQRIRHNLREMEKRTGRRESSCLDSMARRRLDPPAGPSATSIGLVVVGAITRFVSGGSTDG